MNRFHSYLERHNEITHDYQIIECENQKIGMLYRWPFKCDLQYPELGITLLPPFWHKKVGTRVLQQYIQQHNLKCVYFVVHEDHDVSSSFIQKLGGVKDVLFKINHHLIYLRLFGLERNSKETSF